MMFEVGEGQADEVKMMLLKSRLCLGRGAATIRSALSASL